MNAAEARPLLDELREKHRGDQSVALACQRVEQVLSGNYAAKSVFIGIPRLHDIEWGTAKAVLLQCSTSIKVSVHDRISSLLAYGFNNLWCDCLNIGGFNYWLLCHADLSFRTNSWLDVLVHDLERHKLDAIHVPVNIKDDRGLTSTGVGNANDVWAHVRRLTLKEMRHLPSVFTLDDVAAVMKRNGHVPKNPVFCPNTGCLLVKVDPKWWWDFPGFSILDGMETVCVNGRFVRRPRVVSEDWHFGHWMQRRGLRVGATKRVRIDHMHPHFHYSNDAVFGEDRDEGYHHHKQWGRD